MHEPAINGTTGILKAVAAYSSSVKRVVITSSFATISTAPNHPEVYDETIYSPITQEEGMEPMKAYRASKVRGHSELNT